MSKVLVSNRIYLGISIFISVILAHTSAEARVTRTFFHKDVRSGVSTYIYKNEELHQDCTIAHLKGKVWTYPEHGSLQVSTGTVKNTYSKFMLQSKCPRVVASGIKAFYRPNAGYKGPDEAVFYVIDPAGNRSFTTIYLNVR
ncbi:MAG: hypothetical protein AB1440_03235 [Pseudomonadota bacterium]|jgi:hypothetical protein